MGLFVSEEGGIAVGAESTYGTLASAMVQQFAKPSAPAVNHPQVDRPQIRPVFPTTRKFGIPFTDGEINFGFSFERDIIGVILASMGTLDTNDYTFGETQAGGAAVSPDSPWLSVQQNTGGHMMQHLGCVPHTLRLTMRQNEPIVGAIGLLGRDGANTTPVAITYPDEQYLAMPQDLGSVVQINSVDVEIYEATLEVVLQITGSERAVLGSSVLARPRTYGRSAVNCSLTLEFADDTGNDTEAVFDKYLANTAVGDIQIGNFLIEGGYISGDQPGLEESGITPFACAVQAERLTITTQDTIV